MLPRDGAASVGINVDPMSPGSLKLPSLSSWDLPNSTRSPALYAPPDMTSKKHLCKTHYFYWNTHDKIN